MNISRNPAIAYQQGLKEGKERGHREAVDAGFTTGIMVCLGGFYNANADLDFLDENQLAQLMRAAEKESERIFVDELGEKEGQDRTDAIELLFFRTNELRRKFGMEEL